MSEDLELQVKLGLERLEQVGYRMEALKAHLSTGTPLSALQPPPDWSVLRERIKRLMAGNEAVRALAEQLAGFPQTKRNGSALTVIV